MIQGSGTVIPSHFYILQPFFKVYEINGPDHGVVAHIFKLKYMPTQISGKRVVNWQCGN